MADTSIKLSGTYDSIEAYRILEEMRGINTECEEIRDEAASAVTTATSAATTAQGYADNASTYASSAQTYAGNANTSASAAAGSASTASTAANNALDSKTAAASSASAASTSETNAAASATAAAASAAEAGSKAPIDSPAFTGTPTVPTPGNSDNSTKIANTSWVENIFFSKLVAKLAASTAASISSLNTSSLFYRMLSWALTASGVQYNFSNSSAWYICMGNLLGGLIIQGGTRSDQSGKCNFTFPVTFVYIPNIQLSVRTGTDDAVTYPCKIANETTTGFTAITTTSGGTLMQVRTYYLAVGK